MSRFYETRVVLQGAFHDRRQNWVLAGGVMCAAAVGAIALAVVPATQRHPSPRLTIAGQCREQPDGVWAEYSGELVARRAPHGDGIRFYGKVLHNGLTDIVRGPVDTVIQGPFAVVFPAVAPALVSDTHFRLEGVSRHLGLDKAAQPIGGQAVCDLTVLTRQVVR